MISNWALFSEGLGVFAVTCLLPLLAMKTKTVYSKMLLAFTDNIATVISLFMVALSFSHHTTGFIIVAITYLLASLEVIQIAKAHNIQNPYTGKSY